MLNKIRLVMLSAIMITLMSVLPVVTVRADGNLLRGFDVPATTPFGNGQRTLPSIYWPIGVTFDGTNIWYSQPCTCTSDIFQSTTHGVFLNTLQELKEAGALAWDGSHLWVGVAKEKPLTCVAGVTGCAFLSEVDVSTGNVLKTVDISAVFAPDQECGFIDGLSFDAATGTFWVSPDIGCLSSGSVNPCTVGFVYNVDSSGNLIKRVQLPFGVAGDSKVGDNLYLVSCKPSGATGRPVIKTTLDGTVISTFFTVSVSGNRESAESIAFDPVTFAPACALWAVQDYGIPFDASLAAYQIPCP